ncbi:hypothetical protein [Frondihabitans peucedani]|uniref:Glycosyltransferase family 39 protein n=1 Tax=Frondihabitans peucedani TaxID=598626 RepID=A0ABP8E5D1_9MICO
MSSAPPLPRTPRPSHGDSDGDDRSDRDRTDDRAGSAGTRRSRVTDAVLVGLAATAIAVLFSWVPSLWYDEAATVVSATRSWAALGRMLTTVDVVHATYYAGMHLWFDVVGYSPFTLRLPSALATGGAAALTVVLGRMLATRRIGLLAGVVFCVLPRVTWMGLEGRSFALGTLLAVASTILFVTAARRSARRWWIAYAAVAILSSAVFLYLVLVVVAHGVSAVLALLRARKRHAGLRASGWATSRPILRWTLAAALTVVAILPLAVLASRQSGQIHWIPRPSLHTVEEVVTTQWFYENGAFAAVAWALILIGVVAALRRPGQAEGRTARDVLLIAAPWMAVPTLGLIAVSLVHTPLYSPRYVTFGAPAAALAIAVGLDRLPWRRAVPLLVAVLVALSLPTIVAQRQVTAKDDSAWNRVAALVSRERAREPRDTRDAVVYGPVDRHPLTTSRIIADSYPTAFRGLDDIALRTPASETDRMWASDRPLGSVLGKAQDARSVWLLTGTAHDIATTLTPELRRDGFHVGQSWRVSRTIVVRYDR